MSLKQRQAAMQRFLSKCKVTYNVNNHMPDRNPVTIDYEGQTYTVFANASSIVMTKDPVGDITVYKDDVKTMTNIVNFSLLGLDATPTTLDVNSIIADAKDKGFKLIKSEIDYKIRCKYLLHFDDAYYKVGLLAQAWDILKDDRDPVNAYHVKGRRNPLIIVNDIGIAIILPMAVDTNTDPDKAFTVVRA